MANLVINRILDSRFEFSLDGGAPISDNAPNLTTFGNIAHFKTKSGANIVKKQNISFADITVIDTFGGTGTFTFPNIQAVWTKLIELNFFLGVSGSGGGGVGVTRFDALLDTFQYFGNDGKVPVVDESQLRLVPTEFYNVKDFVELNDVGFDTLIAGKVLSVANIGGVPKIVLSDPSSGGSGGTSSLFSAVGGFDYDDLSTKTTALSYTSGDLQITNDILGANTFLSQPPYGVSSVWDESTNSFNFSQLSEGDEVFVRVNIDNTTTASNQKSNLKLSFTDNVLGTFPITIGSEIQNKDAGTHNITEVTQFYVRNSWKSNPVNLYYSSDANASIVVNGFHVYIVRKSVNIIDVSDENFRTFEVNKKQSPLTDVSTLEKTVKIGYDGTTNKVNKILFDKAFSKYLSGYAYTSKKLELTIYNKTKNTTSIAEILSLAYSDGSSQYYVVSVQNIIEQSAISLNDSIEVQISAYQNSGGGTPTGGYTGTTQDVVDSVALKQDKLNTYTETGSIATNDATAFIGNSSPNPAEQSGIFYVQNLDGESVLVFRSDNFGVQSNVQGAGSIENSETGLKIDTGQYSFPVEDGTAGQVQVTDGNGTVTWQDVEQSSGGTPTGGFAGTTQDVVDMFDDFTIDWIDIQGDQKDVNLIGFTDGTPPTVSNITTSKQGNDKYWTLSAFGNGVYVIISSEAIEDELRLMRSTDGINFTISKFREEELQWRSLDFVNGEFVSTGFDTVAKSVDGLNWVFSPTNLFDGKPAKSIAYGNGVYVAVAQTGTVNNVATSTDAVTWTMHSITSLVSVAFGNGAFIAVSPTNIVGEQVYRSLDGVTWTSILPGTTIGWSGVVFGDGNFLAYTSVYSAYIYSKDGLIWTQKTVTNLRPKSVSYGLGSFVAINTVNNKIHATDNLIDWSTEDAVSGISYNTIVTGNNRGVAIGSTTTGANNIVSFSLEKSRRFENKVSEYQLNGERINIENGILNIEAGTPAITTDVISLFLSASGKDLTTGDADTIEAPYAFTLNSAFIAVTDAPTGGNIVVDYKKNGVSITSTKATINSGEVNSLTGVSPVFTTVTFAKGDRITYNIFQVGSITTGKSLKSYLSVTKL